MASWNLVKDAPIPEEFKWVWVCNLRVNKFVWPVRAWEIDPFIHTHWTRMAKPRAPETEAGGV